MLCFVTFLRHFDREYLFSSKMAGICHIFFGIFIILHIIRNIDIHSGSSNLVSLAGGTLIGGILTRKLRMTPRTTFVWSFFIFLVHIITFVFGFFLGCDQPNFIKYSRYFTVINVSLFMFTNDQFLTLSKGKSLLLTYLSTVKVKVFFI